MAIYCEGAKAAEILFSLTGGREGRLMSYAPPVTITYPISGLSCQHIKYDLDTIQTTSVLGGFVFKDRIKIPGYNFDNPFFAELNDILNVSRYAYKLSTSISTSGNLFCLSLKIEEWDKQSQIIKTIHQSSPLCGFDGFFVNSIQVKKFVNNGLLIEDAENLLYFYEIPEGFTPTWQVDCIGCNPGECAGSDGKGGVVCMDCKQMNNDLRIIKKSLSR